MEHRERKEQRQRKIVSREEAEETRNTILRVAQQLFMELGYRSVTTRQIADACGLTQPALYHYFADKQELYVAMAQEELAKTRAALERLASRGDSIDERLRRAALYLLSATRHDHAQLLHDIRHELSPEARATLNEAFMAGIVSPIASIFEDGLAKGLLRSRQQRGTDAVTATFLFMSMISQFLAGQHGSSALASGLAGSASDIARLIVQVILHGLTRPQAEITSL
ncbi:MAG TPA: TetR/AcrR family transcriptional regulator [Ktedonobacteraceae bacterium]|jgi:AcrR family transcriptional regulator|nr:TetR/AcrR family transcriptional regulator [Ktedonobacteraceae bacterium]